eukprot:380687-Hanusia_phi.AAC.8
MQYQVGRMQGTEVGRSFASSYPCVTASFRVPAPRGDFGVGRMKGRGQGAGGRDKKATRMTCGRGSGRGKGETADQADGDEAQEEGAEQRIPAHARDDVVLERAAVVGSFCPRQRQVSTSSSRRSRRRMSAVGVPAAVRERMAWAWKADARAKMSSAGAQELAVESRGEERVREREEADE